MKRINTEIAIERFVKIYGNKNDYSRVVYIKHDKKILVVCKIHNFEFLITPNNHSSGKDCPLCGKEKCIKNNTKTNEQFIKEANMIHNNDFEYLDEYTKDIVEIRIRHKKCGTTFKQKPRNHIIKMHGCLKCHLDSIRKSKELFLIEANNIHNNKYSYFNFIYVNNTTKGIVRCNKHGNFEQSPSTHLSGYGCPRCRESKGEKLVEAKLIELGIDFIFQKSFDGCRNPKTNRKLFFDFYVPKYNCCIEFDGQQHFGINLNGYKLSDDFFEKQKFRDEVKNKYCQDNCIKLIRIPFWKSRDMVNKLNEILI